jgi:hypothetical protein
MTRRGSLLGLSILIFTVPTHHIYSVSLTSTYWPTSILSSLLIYMFTFSIFLKYLLFDFLPFLVVLFLPQPLVNGLIIIWFGYHLLNHIINGEAINHMLVSNLLITYKTGLFTLVKWNDKTILFWEWGNHLSIFHKKNDHI